MSGAPRGDMFRGGRMTSAWSAYFSRLQAEAAAGGAPPGIDEIDGLQAALDAVPAWRAAQFSNTDTTTNLNVASWADAPLAGATDVADAAFTISGAGVAPVSAGLHRVTASLHFTSVGQRAAPQARFFVDGVAAGPVASTGYIRAASGHNEASLHLCALLDLGEGEVVTVRTQAESSVTTAATFAAAGTSTLMIEGFS